MPTFVSNSPVLNKLTLKMLVHLCPGPKEFL
jgi:hypothetical protein